MTASATKVVSYRGYRLTVPAGWPVYRLAQSTITCVRFNRHAVYLGSPGADQHCPAHAAGRTESILVSPLGAQRAGAAEPGDHVVVTATWDRHPTLIRRALGIRSLGGAASGSELVAGDRSGAWSAPTATAAWTAPAATAAQTASPMRAVTVPSAATAGAAAGAGASASASAQPGEVYTGLGFDACATPSSSQMSAWNASPYRAIGVYIGGTNMACAQPNLSSAWVSRQSAAGWHLIPIYVGLQAPSNSCGCAAISGGGAAADGAAAARDAVVQAQAVGLGAGNPLYFDLEGYNPSTAVSSAVLTFLSAWTSQLHTEGYTSGVYSSAASGIRDLVSRAGTAYNEPDDIWIANWNGDRSTVDGNVPAAEWQSHRRLHQYSGAHNETYAGSTINIDGDYLDGATAATGTGSTAAAAGPSLSIAPAADGRIDLYPGWRGVSGVGAWQIVAGQTPSALSPVASPVSAPARLPITLNSAYPYFQVRALSSTGLTLGVSPLVATRAHVAIFGNSVFVPRRGPAAVPVSCFGISACRVSIAITGKITLAPTVAQPTPMGGGLVYFSLTRAEHALLAHANGRRLSEIVTAATSTGQTAVRQLNLVPYTASGRPRRRRAGSSAAVRLLSATDFVAHGWSGGQLTSCLTPSPCSSTTTIVAAGQLIAQTGAEWLGAHEIGYRRFRLTAAGHDLLTRTHGNQLSARIELTNAGTTASAAIVLSSFS